MVTLFIFSEILLFSLLKKRQQLLDTFNSNSRLHSKMGLLIKKCVEETTNRVNLNFLETWEHLFTFSERYISIRNTSYTNISFIHSTIFPLFRCTQWRQVFSCFPGIVVLKHFTILWFHKKHSSIFEKGYRIGFFHHA